MSGARPGSEVSVGNCGCLKGAGAHGKLAGLIPSAALQAVPGAEGYMGWCPVL